MKTYSNIAGTLSDSFRIGKGGVDIIQGEDTPHGDIAPVGSLYIKKQDDDVSVYQHVSVGVWSKLGVAPKPTSYRRTFTHADLSSGQLGVEHNLGQKYVNFVIFDGDSKPISIMDSNAIMISDNLFTINIDALGVIDGEWNIVVNA